MFKHSDGRHNLLQGHLEHFQLTSPKVSISLRFPMQKKVFSLLSHWIVWFSSFVRPRKLFRNCLTNSRFLRRLFKFLIVYKKSVVPSPTKVTVWFSPTSGAVWTSKSYAAAYACVAQILDFWSCWLRVSLKFCLFFYERFTTPFFWSFFLWR